MKFPTPSDIPPFIRFGIVGGIGTLVNTAVLWILTTLGMHYLLASVLATETAIISNFLGNQHYTFKGRASRSRWKTFLRFQAISVTTVVGTVAILALLTETYGQELLLVWNLIAIVVMFLANYVLNRKYTWNGTAPQETPNAKRRPARKPVTRFLFLFALLALGSVFAVPALADNVAVNQLGYHPDGEKRAIVYTDALGGSFGVYDAATDDLVYSNTLQRAREYNDTGGHDSTRTGEVVACQGGQPCLVADFTDLNATGSYYIVFGNTTSPEFSIATNLYAGVVSPVFLEFFNAMLQQGSDYHEDYHSGYDPHFPTMADGSFILVSDQASLPLIRLSSAYRRNPAIFQADTYDIVGEDIPDMQEYIMIYADYLASLQGVRIQERSDGVGFRLNTGIKNHNVFVPGPTDLTQVDVFVNTNTTVVNGTVVGYSETLEVRSLCGDLHGAQYNECIDYAADVYKCQEDEPCLNRSYISKTGVVTGYSGYNVSRGWQYEFACDLDVDVNAPMFNGQYDPCFVFDRSTTTKDTARAMLAYLEALPAVYDYSPGEAQQLFDRAYATYEEIERHHDLSGADSETLAYWGASLFMLYEYTGNETFLIDAHALNTSVDRNFDTYITHGNEFYWEEYIRNKDAILLAGLPYEVDGDDLPHRDPSYFFQNKLDFDYKGEPTSMDQSAERVYEKFRGARFSNSRPVLIEGLFAAKTLDHNPSPASFIPEIAESQISWVLGRNSVQDGVAHGSPTRSYSFVFGIGNHPAQFHSRYLIDTGMSARTAGEVIGTRGTSLYFLDPNSNSTRFNASKEDFFGFDGKTSILGFELGASGNGWHNETQIDPWQLNMTFRNGREFIPGWINGPFDVDSETDVIYNYHDTLKTYEFTESTNEMVAVALEYIAHIDAQANGRSAHAPISFSITPDTNGTLDVTTLPGGATIMLGPDTFGTTDGLGRLVNPWPAGTYNVTVVWPDFTIIYDTVTIIQQETTVVSYEKPGYEDGVFVFTTTPVNATVYINRNDSWGNTDEFGHLNISLPPGTYEVMVGFAAMPYTVYLRNHTLTEGAPEYIDVVLHPRNATLNITSIPDGASITLDGVSQGTTPRIIMDVLPDVPHTINVTKTGYLPNSTTFTPGKGEVLDIPIVLTQLPVIILGNSTNASALIFELTPVQFDLTLTHDAPVTWTVTDGTTTVATAQTNTSAPTFTWTPDVFFTSNYGTAYITADTGSGNVTWTTQVENVINPYFSGDFGATTAEIHVFTNNHAVNFTHVNATVVSSSGTVEYALEGEASGDEVEWELAFTAAEGNNNLTRVTGFDSTTNTTVIYDIDPTRRTHYREFAGGGGNTGGSGGGGRPSSGGGGGGGAVPADENSLNVPQLIYVTLTEDVFDGEGGTQTVRLDAKATFGGSVKAATVVLDGPDGETRVRLSLVNGDSGYGTWEASFDAGSPGKHEVVEVILEDGSGDETSVRVRDRSYYVNDPEAGQELGIIYTLLDQSSVETGTVVTLRLDARDIEGIVSGEALIVPNRQGDPFTIPLALVNGDGTYGTWEGSFTPEIPDSTYVIKEIHLSRADGTLAIRRIQDREVYVQPEPASGDLLTGNVVSNLSFEQMIKEPLLPTMLAFGAMVIIIAGVAIAKRLKGR